MPSWYLLPSLLTLILSLLYLLQVTDGWCSHYAFKNIICWFLQFWCPLDQHIFTHEKVIFPMTVLQKEWGESDSQASHVPIPPPYPVTAGDEVTVQKPWLERASEEGCQCIQAVLCEMWELGKQGKGVKEKTSLAKALASGGEKWNHPSSIYTLSVKLSRITKWEMKLMGHWKWVLDKSRQVKLPFLSPKS